MSDYKPQDGLMKPDRAVGIVGYGAYVPRYRLPASEVSKMWTNGTGGTPIIEKAVNGLDEDVITMSIEAARNAMLRAQINPQEIRAVWVGSENRPHLPGASRPVLVAIEQVITDPEGVETNVFGSPGNVADLGPAVLPFHFGQLDTDLEITHPPTSASVGSELSE